MAKQTDEQLHAMRHSQAHILAAAIQKLWPNTKFGVGPVIEDGFYYDVDSGATISEDDFAKIEEEMQAIIEADLPIEKSEKPIDEAIAWAKDAGQDYKLELLNDLKREGTTSATEISAEQLGVEAADDSQVDTVSFYTIGEFTDLCHGPHVATTGKVGAFKLHKIAGAYWRGDETKPQLQRVYGWGFASVDELDQHIQRVNLALERDHRRLGAELDLFTFSDLVGSGLPLFTPRGTILRELLGSYSQQLREVRGFRRIWTPHITKHELYKTSGHWEKFGDELFLVKSQESSDEFALKPMNCPHHTQIYASRQRSYRDLPIKYMENATDYRDEKSGELHGLSRVRAFTQDDSHVFCRPDQIEEVAGELVAAAKEMYKQLDMELKFRLGFRDESDAFLGDSELWVRAQELLKSVADKNKLDYFTEEGDAAFYGPKIDFLATDALGREWQVATVQLDFIQPQRFELTYTAENGEEQTPVMIHCALLGSMERFLSVYIEHVDGHFPFWLAPEQVRILTVNDQTESYVEDVARTLDSVVLMQPLEFNRLRFSIDDRNESLGKKIREATTEKVPVLFIIGPKDADAQMISVRLTAQDGKEDKIAFSDIESYLHGSSSS